MVSYFTTSSCYIILLLYVVKEPVQSQVVMLTRSESVNAGEENVCPEREITFTCVTTGSAIIAWVSNEYIEPGGAQLRLASFNRPGDTQNSTFNPNTSATLIRNEMDISLLESQLRIIATMDYPNPSVTCINVDHGTVNRTSFQMLDNPLMPVVEKKAVQREHIGGTCILTFCWNPPSNLNEADIMHYAVRINGTMYSRNETSTLAAFHVPNCGRHEVSVSAVNRCDREGPFSNTFLLDPEIRKPLPMSTVTVSSICKTEATTFSSVTEATTFSSVTVNGNTECTVPCYAFAPIVVVLVLLSAIIIVAVIISCIVIISHTKVEEVKKIVGYQKSTGKVDIPNNVD